MFNKTIPNEKTKMFLDPAGPVGIARYDKPKYPVFDKLTKKQNGFFWMADEVDCSKDGKDFRTRLDDSQRRIITYNLYRQIVLDSKQGREPSAVLAPIASLPEIEIWIQTWNYFETVHSRAYTHIIQNAYSDPSAMLDGILDIEPVLKCAEAISEPYDEVDKWNRMLASGDSKYDSYEHKRSLWRCINSINALEGIRFYVSFACTWAFAELKLMEGNAKIIKFIARDENIHLAGTQHMLKLLVKDDADFKKIAEEERQWVQTMFESVVEQEIEWAEFLFEQGSMIGLNAELLGQYIKWLANKRMRAVGLDAPYDVGGSNPLPWTEKWISGGDVQVAPQETEITSYVHGAKRDLDAKQFEGFEL